jgi:hypothetical protein
MSSYFATRKRAQCGPNGLVGGGFAEPRVVFSFCGAPGLHKMGAVPALPLGKRSLRLLLKGGQPLGAGADLDRQVAPGITGLLLACLDLGLAFGQRLQ